MISHDSDFGKIADIGPPHVGLHNRMFPDEIKTRSLNFNGI